MKCKMFSYEQKAIGVAVARLRGARATADASLEVVSLCSAVLAPEAGSGSTADAGRPDRVARMQAG